MTDTVVDQTQSAAEGDRSTRAAIATMYRLTTGHRASLTLATVLTLVGSALGLAQPLAAKQVVDASGRGQVLWPLLLLLAGLFVTEAATGAVGRFVLERMGEGIVRGLRHSLVGGCSGWRCGSTTGSAAAT